MKILVEWDCVKCGLVHINVNLNECDEQINVKCPICGIPRMERNPLVCSEKLSACNTCEDCF